MKLMKVVVVGAAVLLLAGCSTADAHPAAVQKPATHSATSGKTAEPTDWKFCSDFMDSMSPYADLILKLSQTGNIAQGDLDTLGTYISDLDNDASSKIQATLTDYEGPYNVISSAVNSGAGSVNFNTDAYKTASTNILKYCSGTVGYHNG